MFHSQGNFSYTLKGAIRALVNFILPKIQATVDDNFSFCWLVSLSILDMFLSYPQHYADYSKHFALSPIKAELLYQAGGPDSGH